MVVVGGSGGVPGVEVSQHQQSCRFQGQKVLPWEHLVHMLLEIVRPTHCWVGEVQEEHSSMPSGLPTRVRWWVEVEGLSNRWEE